MNYGQALQAAREGKLIARQGWNGKGMYVFFVPGSKFIVNRPPLLGIFPNGTEIVYRPHLDMKYADGTVGVWMASHSDMLEADWMIVE